MLAVLGVFGSARGVSDVLALVAGESVEPVVATVSPAAMIATCLVLLGAVSKIALETR